MSLPPEPTIVEFGPYRVIGLNYIGKNEHKEITALWSGPDGMQSRMDFKPALPAGANFAIGLCRCLPGATDGTFEYIAALPVTADAPVPAGMVEAIIPASTYAAFPVAGLEGLKDVWCHTNEWLAAHPEWQWFCSADGCDCARHPSFELYPPEFITEGNLFVYLPVRPVTGK